MRVLWVTNGPTDEVQYERHGIKEGGVSWVTGLLDSIRSKNIIIDILYMGGQNDDFYEKTINGTTYYSFLRSKKTYSKNKKNNEYFKNVLKQNYDIIHIFGTEYYHSLEMFNLIEDKSKILISIQGLCSIIENHFLLGLPTHIIYRHTIRDIIKRDSLLKQKKEFKLRGINERLLLSNSLNIIGRTDWDKSCTWLFNANRKYYKANEILRSGFYSNSWSYEKCEKYSIFLSQVYSPLKGFHYLLEAVGILKKYYPNIIIRTTGDDFIHDCTLKNKLKLSSYRKYILELVDKYNLYNNVEFLGSLSEPRMIEEYKRAHVFVSASSIENSPNSVAEAMLLGVPIISSDVGGVKNLLTHLEDGFIYPSDEPYMLAYYIKELFENKALCLEFSENATRHAKNTHDRKTCANDVYNIYLDILSKK